MSNPHEVRPYLVVSANIELTGKTADIVAWDRKMTLAPTTHNAIQQTYPEYALHWDEITFELDPLVKDSLPYVSDDILEAAAAELERRRREHADHTYQQWINNRNEGEAA